MTPGSNCVSSLCWNIYVLVNYSKHVPGVYFCSGRSGCMAGHACSQSVSSREWERQKGTTAAVCVCVFLWVREWIIIWCNPAMFLRWDQPLVFVHAPNVQQNTAEDEQIYLTFVILHLKRRITVDELQTPVHEFHHDVLWHGCHLEPVCRTAAWRVCLVLEGAGHQQQQLFILPECMFCLFAMAVMVAVHRSRLTLWFLCFAANLFIYLSVSATLESPTTTTAQWDVASRL